jgi:hypothetical protein
MNINQVGVKKKNNSIIHNIDIKSEYQCFGYGNYLLNFYKKNNYIIKENYNTYDDGEYIYNFYKIIKFLK